MAQVAHAIGIRELPDQGVVLAHDASRAGLDAVRAINVVSTLDAAVRSLHQDGERPSHTFPSLSKWKYLVTQILFVKTVKW